MITKDDRWMRRALDLSLGSRRVAPPNPWVGAVIVDAVADREVGAGATCAPGLSHAEVVALDVAGPLARGATLFVTLEPCGHSGRTGPCTQRIIDAGVAKVVVALIDPDERVAGAGVRTLRDAGLEVTVGVLEEEASQVLAPYLWHRRTRRPYVVLKVAATLDGRVAMADGTSQWITGEAARADAHELRGDSQAILVGAGTVRADNPALTARTSHGVVEPLRVVLGRAPVGSKVHPCLERQGELGPVLDELGQNGVLQLLVEGGPYTASEFLREGLVNRLVWYVAPAWAGAASGSGALSQFGTESIGSLQRGRILDVRRIGEDIRMELEI